MLISVKNTQFGWETSGGKCVYCFSLPLLMHASQHGEGDMWIRALQETVSHGFKPPAEAQNSNL